MKNLIFIIKGFFSNLLGIVREKRVSLFLCLSLSLVRCFHKVQNGCDRFISVLVGFVKVFVQKFSALIKKVYSSVKNIIRKCKSVLGRIRQSVLNLVKFWDFSAFKIAISFSIIVVIIAFALENLPYPWNDKALPYSILNYIRLQCIGDKKMDDVVFVNVSRDMQLVDLPKENGGGNTYITNRNHLFQLLKRVENFDYKYVYLDIRFDKDYVTADDDSLFCQILKMENIVIPNHLDSSFTIADTQLLSKSAYCDYISGRIISTNFFRYQFYQKEGPSIALKMYSDLTGSTIHKNCFLCTSNNKLLVNCPVIYLYGNVTKNNGAAENDNYMNLNDILDSLKLNPLKYDFSDKYIIIADFENELYDTYAGPIPKAYIDCLAFKSLMNADHYFDLRFWLRMFIIFFCCIYCYMYRYYSPVLSSMKISIQKNTFSLCKQFWKNLLAPNVLFDLVLGVLIFIYYMCYHSICYSLFSTASFAFFLITLIWN